MPPHLGMTDKLDFLEGDKKEKKEKNAPQSSKKALNKKG